MSSPSSHQPSRSEGLQGGLTDDSVTAPGDTPVVDPKSPVSLTNQISALMSEHTISMAKKSRDDKYRIDHLKWARKESDVKYKSLSIKYAGGRAGVVAQLEDAKHEVAVYKRQYEERIREELKQATGISAALRHETELAADYKAQLDHVKMRYSELSSEHETLLASTANTPSLPDTAITSTAPSQDLLAKINRIRNLDLELSVVRAENKASRSKRAAEESKTREKETSEKLAKALQDIEDISQEIKGTTKVLAELWREQYKREIKMWKNEQAAIDLSDKVEVLNGWLKKLREMKNGFVGDLKDASSQLEHSQEMVVDSMTS